MSGLSLKNLEILLSKTNQEMLPKTRQIPKRLLKDHDLNLQIESIHWNWDLEFSSSSVDAMTLSTGRTTTLYTSSSKPLASSSQDSATSAPSSPALSGSMPKLYTLNWHIILVFFMPFSYLSHQQRIIYRGEGGFHEQH